MDLNERINAFLKLGDFLRSFLEGRNRNTTNFEKLAEIVQNDHFSNPWFTEENIRKSLSALAISLKESNLRKWISDYSELNSRKEPKRVGVVSAGNLPLVGFHDFLSVLVSGNVFIGKLSTKDDRLLRFIANYLTEVNPEFKSIIFFEEKQLTSFDAVIATGSNNSSRYFEYYFGKYPHIIRRNRNSVAVLTGLETSEQLKLLADDIFQYFGLGCRNVSKLFVPEGYSFNQFFDCIEHYQYLYRHNKYANNYDYNRSVYLMNQTPHLDAGFCLLKEDIQLASPISVIYYEYYKTLDKVLNRIEVDKEQIQCVVSGIEQINAAIPFGKAQQPELWDYADNIDTLKFLISI